MILKGKKAMAVSKWEINRIGLIDFWYYDEQEFYFADGRMLLKGANGSGKSVTMQSFIPLLLDGNKASDRLDPFGTKARKMENYLLEENDGREERIGYLYMEFRRKESDTFFTVGIGLRARRNKKLDSWYFAILDGRRIGHDFNLYKEVGEKVSLSKAELKNRLGEGGIIMETQNEYMKFVNERLFGYETIDEYKELIDLLLQLRKPKLSKDFKPTVLNEILSESLQTISEDDLRPMSEAIENMDNMKNRLEDLKRSKNAADKILGYYNQYNEKVLFDKAKDFDAVMSNYENEQNRMNDMKQKNAELEKELENLEKSLLQLKDERELLEKKKADLNLNDIAAVKEKEIKLRNEVEHDKQELNKKESYKEDKESSRIDAENKLKEQQQKAKREEALLVKKLDELSEHAEAFHFDEFNFVRGEVLENTAEKYDFSLHKSEVQRIKSDVALGLKMLQEIAGEEKEYDRLNQKKEEENRVKLQLERDVELLESQETQIKNEFVEKIYRWNQENRQLVLSDDDIRKISIKAENFDRNSDFLDITEAVFREKAERTPVMQKEYITAQGLYAEISEKVREKEAELSEWENKKDPEPERSPEVLKNRALLDEKKIPYTSFYKVVDFAENLSEKQADILEEALLEMGILDALILPSNYENQVMAIDEGTCDKYLFANTEHVQQSIGSWLRMDSDVQDLVLYQSITNIIESIGGTQNNATFVTESGRFGMGVLQGTVTKRCKAKYIGVKAREKFKQKTIERLSEELRELKTKQEEQQQIVHDREDALEVLDKEYAAFPSGDDLKEAVKLLGDAIDTLEKQNLKIGEIETQIKECFEKIKEVRIEISKISQKVGLEARKSIFEEAKEEIGEYEKGILEAEHIQDAYISCKEMCDAYENQIYEIDDDLDRILYDINRLERSILSNEQEIENCVKQLKLSRYDEIKAELDYCLERLSKLPEEIEQTINKKAEIGQRLINSEREIQKLDEHMVMNEKDVELMKAGFCDELNLGYVEYAANLTNHEDAQTPTYTTESLKNIAGDIIAEFEKYNEKPQNEYMLALQEKFHENLNETAEYKLQLNTIFTSDKYSEYEKGFKNADFSRMAIYGHYQSKTVEFPQIIKHLVEDIAVQEQLITENDRIIFEDILVNTISKKIRAKIYKSEEWVRNMNRLMEGMDTSSGLKLNLKWKHKKAEYDGQLDTRELVELLKKDAKLLKDTEVEKLSKHFQSKVQEARRLMLETGNTQSFHSIIRETLDYRKWFEFQLYYQKGGEDKKELTNNAFFTLSGGEKAMAMYVPLFSAVVSKYAGARSDAPKLIALDEAFAGVDETNIRDMFKLMIELDFQFVINSQILWGDYDTVPNLAIYELLRPENARFVTVMSYTWNGHCRSIRV